MAVKVIERRRSVRQACTGDLPAPLLRAVDASLLQATSLDASKHGLGLLCPVDLALGEGLTLALGERPLQMVVAWKAALTGPKQFRFGLAPLDPQDDIEARMRAAGCLVPSGGGNARVPAQPPIVKIGRGFDNRAARYTVDWELCVDTKTLGTKNTYRLLVANISRSGLLVTEFQKEMAPFQVNTLIEIILDPTAKHMAKPVHGFAKVVRQLVDKDPDGTKRVSFGVVISEIFAEDKAVWEGFMRSLEKDAVPYTGIEPGMN